MCPSIMCAIDVLLLKISYSFRFINLMMTSKIQTWTSFSTFLITMIGVQSPMDKTAEDTLTQALRTFLDPFLEASNIGLDTVSVVNDPQQLGVMLDVSVKFTGLYRPPVEQNLGAIIIVALNSGTQSSFSAPVVIQNAFISSLGNQGSYFSGVVSALLTLKENGSKPVPRPTPPPTRAPPTPPPTRTSELVSKPTYNPPSIPAKPPSPKIFYLSVILYNTPYQTRYMSDADFDKFTEVFVTVVNEMRGSMTNIKRISSAQHRLISIGNYGLTATEINLGYEVYTNLQPSEVGYAVARAVSGNKEEMMSLLQRDYLFYPFYLEIDEIQAQNIASMGDPISTANLPNVIPEKPTAVEEDTDKVQAEKEVAEAQAVAKAQEEIDRANAIAADQAGKNGRGSLGSGGE